MSTVTEPRWKSMRTDETRRIEDLLKTKFPRSDAYRYNSASIRVRVIDPKFEGKSAEDRDAMVEPLLAKLPAETQGDIMTLLTLTPDETATSRRKELANLEFEDPSPSTL